MSQKPEVLVVDDDLFFSVRIETMLRRAGYAVHVARSGAEALTFANQQTPALAIINFGSARLGPAEIVHQLKTISSALPVLCFMPHKQMPELRPQARAAGADLIVANSALTLRLPVLAAKLAPLPGDDTTKKP